MNLSRKITVCKLWCDCGWPWLDFQQSSEYLEVKPVKMSKVLFSSYSQLTFQQSLKYSEWVGNGTQSLKRSL